LNYFEKWIYAELVKIQFLDFAKLKECDFVIRKITLFPIFYGSRAQRLEKALNNKYYCLFEIAKLFEIKFAIGIIINSFKKGFKIESTI